MQHPLTNSQWGLLQGCYHGVRIGSNQTTGSKFYATEVAHHYGAYIGQVSVFDARVDGAVIGQGLEHGHPGGAGGLTVVRRTLNISIRSQHERRSEEHTSELQS